MNEYLPLPILTTDIELPASLKPLLEKIAEHNHDIWARQRLNEGWTYGPNRNDETKQTPCLVAYKELPEIEKQYDRNTAIEVLKAIVALGYNIEKRL